MARACPDRQPTELAQRNSAAGHAGDVLGVTEADVDGSDDKVREEPGVGSRLASIGSAMPRVPHGNRGESFVLAISSDCARNRFGLSCSPSRGLTEQPHRLRVGLRSHWIYRGQDRTFSSEVAFTRPQASKPHGGNQRPGEAMSSPLCHLVRQSLKNKRPHVVVLRHPQPRCFGASSWWLGGVAVDASAWVWKSSGSWRPLALPSIAERKGVKCR